MSAATVQQPETDFDWQPVGEVLAALGARLEAGGCKPGSRESHRSTRTIKAQQMLTG